MSAKHLVLLILAVVSATKSSYAKSLPPQTFFYNNQTDYILIPDEFGTLHYVDLHQEVDTKVTVTPSDITIYLYTKKNLNSPHIISNCNIQDLLNAPNYDSRKSNIFVMHGWNNKHTSAVNTETKSSLLKISDINVFVVDWSGLAGKIYTTAVGAVPKVGTIVGDFINNIIKTYKLRANDFKLIGHSLGAHVAGCTGAQVAKVSGKVDYIVGLDPAGPFFSEKDTDSRLDPTDGEFVHVIHTNGGLLGYSKSIGHADYYPNGGNKQAGCGVDIAGTCAHSRSYYYLGESIVSSNFHSISCDSYKNFENGACKNNKKSLMGGFPIDKSARGDYYLKTNDNQPYAQGPL